MIDIKFPISWDCDNRKIYLFDANMDMFAQTDYKTLDATKEYHPFEKFIGEYKDVFNTANYARYYLKDGDFYDMEGKGEPIGCVRGWGRLQYKKSPKGEVRQDNIADYMLTALNT